MYAATGMLSEADSKYVTWNKAASFYYIGFYPALGTNGNYAVAVWYDHSDNLFSSVAWVP